MRFHLDLDGGRPPAAAHTSGDEPRGAPRPVRPLPANPARADTLPVLQQAVADPAPTPQPGWFTADAPDADTLVVPAGARIRGDCHAASVHVHGEVLGRVRATTGLLLVAPGGRVRGGVEGGGAVVIAGQVSASRGADAVVAHGRLDLAGSARVTGTVCHGVVAIYVGARVTGELRNIDRRRRP